MSLISRLFGKGSDSSEVLCPRCERAMQPGHECRGLSRRFFFGALAGAAAAVTLPQVIIEPACGSGNALLTIQAVTWEMLNVLHNNLIITRSIDRELAKGFAVDGSRIGDTIEIRRPRRFAA